MGKSRQTGLLVNEVHGFESDSASVLSFIDGTRTFYITGSNFAVWNFGNRLLKNTQSIQIDNIDGKWYIYYNSQNTLSSSQASWDLNVDIPIAIISWSVSGGTGEIDDQRRSCYETNHIRLVRDRDLAHPSTDITVDVTRFNRNLSAADDTVQKALDTLDDMLAGSGTYYPEGLISGGQQSWISGYTYRIASAIYRIGGVVYTSPSTTVTLDPSDPSNSRIDLIILTTDSVASKLTGVAATNPVKPQVDPITQLELNFVLLPANSSSPSGITDELVYDENNEWTASSTGVTVNFDSTTLPYRGSKCADVETVGNADLITFVNQSVLDIADFETLLLHIKLKAPTTVEHIILCQLLLAGDPVTNNIPVVFDPSILEWQGCIVDFTYFMLFGSTFDTVQLYFEKVGDDIGYDGFYLDYIKLQSGVTQPEINSSHNSLLGLQGGSESERYHLTAAEYASIHPPVTIATASAAFGSIDANQELTLTEPTWDALPDKPAIPTVPSNSDIEDISFEWDVSKGTAQTFTLDIKASFAYNILSATLEVDTGTLTGVAVKIGSTAVTSLSSITVDSGADETTATGANSVVAGNRVYLVTSTGYTGAPTLIRGKLKKQRV